MESQSINESNLCTYHFLGRTKYGIRIDYGIKVPGMPYAFAVAKKLSVWMVCMPKTVRMKNFRRTADLTDLKFTREIKFRLYHKDCSLSGDSILRYALVASHSRMRSIMTGYYRPAEIFDSNAKYQLRGNHREQQWKINRSTYGSSLCA
ncbi:uncharacterized protein LOC112495200 [Cephus cinctus]|uniref:Uncharacterized protein LOC112495200 n=1 Tax=Cephus cinctus TaxID=211228 RepID=A0AAJ7W6S9_CEPCN|nr:uncharacterized protein LOC112495200 [Cephus cinctus]